MRVSVRTRGGSDNDCADIGRLCLDEPLGSRSVVDDQTGALVTVQTEGGVPHQLLC